MAAQQTILTEWSAWAPTPRANKAIKKEVNMVCGIQQRSIVAMIGSDANNRFRDIVSSKVLENGTNVNIQEGSWSKSMSAVSYVEVILDNIAG
jgi:hypothetical protein